MTPSARNFHKVFVITVSALALAALVSACTPRVTARGNLPDPDKISQLKPGKHTRADVAQMLGTPSSTGAFDDRTWYYISNKTKRLAYFKPEVLNQRVYVLKFDKAGVLKDVNDLNLADARAVKPVERKTPTRGTELTFLQSIYKTIVTGPAGALGGAVGGPVDDAPGEEGFAK